MPTALKSNRDQKGNQASVFQNTLGIFVGLYLIISLIATMFQVESAWTWPLDILDLASHMIAGHCVYPGSHS